MKGTFRELVDRLRVRKRQYQSAFSEGAPGHEAMADLARFCRAFGNDIVPGDHDKTLIMAGRREAFWRIYQHLHLEPQQLVALYTAAVFPQQEQDQ